MTKGDAILIPEGTPHQDTAVEGSITYLEVRFSVPIDEWLLVRAPILTTLQFGVTVLPRPGKRVRAETNAEDVG